VIPDGLTAYDPRPEYIGELIESTGLTQERLGEVLGVAPRTIRKWLSGERQFPYLAQFALECLVLNAAG
jgi:transcriptional regulator with XRE-family HTH domain